MKKVVMLWWQFCLNRSTLLSASIIGIVFSCAYFGFSSRDINKQGLYYDELHQAPSSFYYVGKPQEMFSLGIKGIPVLNMTYSGAIKSAVFGAYLKISGNDFTVRSWRYCGIFFVVLGIFSFSLLTVRCVSNAELAIVLLLLLTDTMVLLSTRHDWGPVALSLLLRLIAIALIIRGLRQSQVSTLNTFIMSAIFGIAVFEKLSSVALLVPLLLIMIVDKKRLSKNHWIASAAGLIAGLSPLIFVNVGSFLIKGKFVSILDAKQPILSEPVHLTDFIFNYVGLANGNMVSKFIFGVSNGMPHWIEPAILSSLIIILIVVGMMQFLRTKKLDISVVMVVSYLLVAVGLFSLPRETGMHHWIIGTPFQYCAFALFLGSIGFSGPTGKIERGFIIVFAVLLCFLLGQRILVFSETQKMISKGTTALPWDASLNRLGEFANEHRKNTTFITADWGVATQILCLSNGEPNIVKEPFYRYKGQTDLDSIVSHTSSDTFYLVIPKFDLEVAKQNRKNIVSDFPKTDGLYEVSVEQEGQMFACAILRKFVRKEQ